MYARRTLLLVVLLLTVGNHAQAAIDLGGFGSLSWDRVAQPAASTAIVLSFQHIGAGSTPLDSFNVGITITGGNGDLEVGTVTPPPSNNLFPTFDTGYPNVNDVMAGVQAINGASSTQAITSTLLSSTKSAVAFNFVSPGGTADGVYQVYAVPEYSSYFDTAGGDFDGQRFANAQVDNYLLGTVTVYSVPEPTTWAALIGGGAVLAGLAWRRRRRGARGNTVEPLFDE